MPNTYPARMAVAEVRALATMRRPDMSLERQEHGRKAVHTGDTTEQAGLTEPDGDALKLIADEQCHGGMRKL